MAAPLTNFKAGGEDLADAYVDTETVTEGVTSGLIPIAWLSDAGKDAIVNKQLWLWGSGIQGRLGLNNVIDRSSPVQLGSENKWVYVSSGQNHFAIDNNNAIWTWGSGGAFLGLNNSTSFSSPVQIGTLTNWAKAFGNNSFANFSVKTDGTLWAWGRNTPFANLGLNDTINRSSPVQVGTLTNWSSVSNVDFLTQSPLNPPNFIRLTAGATLSVKTDGTLWSWGGNFFTSFTSSNGYTDSTPHGVLGLNSGSTTVLSPTQVGSLNDWKYVSMGGSTGLFALAVKTNNTLWAWGTNSSGQLGFGDVIFRSSPVQVGSLADWKSVSASTTSVIALKTDGTLWAWGAGSNGVLGLNDTIARSSPVQVGTLADWKYLPQQISSSAAAVKTDGTLWVWGINSSGKLGLNDTIARSSPVQVGTLTDWKSVSAAGNGMAALK